MELALRIHKVEGRRRNERVIQINLLERVGREEIRKYGQRHERYHQQRADNGRLALAEAPPDELEIAFMHARLAEQYRFGRLIERRLGFLRRKEGVG